MQLPNLPRRRGPRPRTTPTNPHAQLDQHAPAGLIEELARRCFALPDVDEQLSRISVPGARALVLAEDVAPGPPEAFIIGREFAHIHPLPDGSLHMALPPDTARLAMEQGWAEPHPVARMGWIPPTIVMVYAPRDPDELKTVMALVQASHAFACGRAD